MTSFRRSLLLTTATLLGCASALPAEPTRTFFPADPADTPTYSLPDPLVTRDGRSIRSKEEWISVRRPEILELFRQHVYGRVPATPYRMEFVVVNEDQHAMDGAATLREVDIRIVTDRGSLKIRLNLFIPNRAPRPAPAFLLICNRSVTHIDPTRQQKSPYWPAEELIARGFAAAAFFNGDVDPDRKADTEFQDGIHALLDPRPRPDDAWGTLAAWAWGASRCLDYLVTVPGIDPAKVAVIGQSRGGKAALWAGAEDPRFALVCSNDSGCGGAALTRRRAKGKETVAVITAAFPHWFNRNFPSYAGREDELPVDQHLLMALIAPRAIAVHSASEDLWADPRGEFLSLAHARPVFELFGHRGLGAAEMPAIGETLHGDRAHYHIRAGKHNLTLEDWTAYLDFADRLWPRR